MWTAPEQIKPYEFLALRHDPHHGAMIAATDIVKQFIQSRNLIIYGGTAIDFALRLVGDSIYPDDALEVPDLDFYSSTNVEHSYELADILYDEGYIHARAINAEHMRTMKVDLVENHWIADISYQPPEVFTVIPTLDYFGMKIVDPLFQRIDQHSALSFPYDNAPREVIFARWSKDLARFEKLVTKYPCVVAAELMVAPPQMSAKIDLRKYVLYGDLAYSVYYTDFVRAAHDRKLTLPCVIDAPLTIDDTAVTFAGENVSIVHFDVDKACVQLGLHAKKFEPIGSLIGARAEDGDVHIYDTHGKLLSIVELEIAGIQVRVVCVQYLLKYYLSKYFLTGCAAYLARYESLMIMMRLDVAPSMGLSVNVFGNENINLAREVQLNRLNVELGRATSLVLPTNYYPARAREKNAPHPRFDPEQSEFFRERGRLIDSHPV